MKVYLKANAIDGEMIEFYRQLGDSDRQYLMCVVHIDFLDGETQDLINFTDEMIECNLEAIG